MRRIAELLSSVSDTTRALVLTGIFLVASVASWFVYSDTRLLEKKIAYKKKDVAVVLDLRQRYEARKKAIENPAALRSEAPRLSLASLEALAATAFAGGKLAGLRPAAGGTGKEKSAVTIEMKVTGAPLKEVVAFLKAAGEAGFSVNKVQLTMPPNQTTLDMQAVVSEGKAP